tara:strand:+ start:2643 stop:2789 length:147 start_codon:yes stop_codon:yes gene_type:complete
MSHVLLADTALPWLSLGSPSADLFGHNNGTTLAAELHHPEYQQASSGP